MWFAFEDGLGASFSTKHEHKAEGTRCTAFYEPRKHLFERVTSLSHARNFMSLVDPDAGTFETVELKPCHAPCCPCHHCGNNDQPSRSRHTAGLSIRRPQAQKDLQLPSFPSPAHFYDCTKMQRERGDLFHWSKPVAPLKKALPPHTAVSIGEHTQKGPSKCMCLGGPEGLNLALSRGGIVGVRKAGGRPSFRGV